MSEMEEEDVSWDSDEFSSLSENKENLFFFVFFGISSGNIRTKKESGNYKSKIF